MWLSWARSHFVLVLEIPRAPENRRYRFSLVSAFRLAASARFVQLNRFRDVAQFGRALRSGRRGRRFKSCHLDQNKEIGFRLSPYFIRRYHAMQNLEKGVSPFHGCCARTHPDKHSLRATSVQYPVISCEHHAFRAPQEGRAGDAELILRSHTLQQAPPRRKISSISCHLDQKSVFPLWETRIFMPYSPVNA